MQWLNHSNFMAMFGRVGVTWRLDSFSQTTKGTEAGTVQGSTRVCEVGVCRADLKAVWTGPPEHDFAGENTGSEVFLREQLSNVNCSLPVRNVSLWQCIHNEASPFSCVIPDGGGFFFFASSVNIPSCPDAMMFDVVYYVILTLGTNILAFRV